MVAVLTKWRRIVLIACCTLTALLCVSLRAATAPIPEYQVKAVFLFHFAQFVEWPEGPMRDPGAPFVISILGPDPFGEFLNEAVAGEQVSGRAIIIKRYARLADLEPSHILFVHESLLPQLGDILSEAQRSHTLTVGDAPDFAARGGMVRFQTVAGKVRFLINLESAQAAQLTISSKLLRRATIVKGRG
jgi:hypothetical protein